VNKLLSLFGPIDTGFAAGVALEAKFLRIASEWLIQI